MQTIAVSNQKGGTGKTSISVHLAMALLEKNKRVLFIDLDPQANASKTIHSMGAVALINASQLFEPELSITEAGDSNFSLIPADNLMADIERANSSVLQFFKDNLGKIKSSYDFCIIDTPPTLGLRMTAALLVANYVVSPIELEEYSIDGVTKMLQTIFGVKQNWNPDLEFLGMIPNRFNSRSATQKKTMESLIKEYAHLLIPAHIGIRSSIPDALAQGIPVWKLKKTSARIAGQEFKKVFDVMFKKMGVK